jgi:hypothetical protein
VAVEGFEGGLRGWGHWVGGNPGLRSETWGTQSCGASCGTGIGGGFGGFDSGEEGFGEFEGAVEFGDAAVPVVKLDVEDADLADVAALKAVQARAELGEGGLALGERGAEGGEGELRAGERGFFRGGEAEDGARIHFVNV